MSRVRAVLLPAYLFLCLVLGGSTQAAWPNAVLQLLAVAILIWAALTRDPEPLPAAGRRLLLIVGGLGLLFIVQLVPLPPGLWQGLPGRDFLAQGYQLLGMTPPWLPLSLAPYETMATALTLLPPLALLVGLLRLRGWSIEAMCAALLAGAFVSIMLGILQVVSGDQGWYFYRRTNLGLAVGAFANANHLATLMLVALPVLAAVVAGRWRAAHGPQQRAFATAIALGAGAVLAAGFLMSRSLAVLLLGPPIALATAALVLRLPKRRQTQALAAAGLMVALAVAAIALFGRDLPTWGANASVGTRMEYWSKSMRVVGDHGLTGAGLGTFEVIYPHYENPERVQEFYANHAHNDFVEIAVETGLPGLLLLAVFLFWWFGRVRAAWASSGLIEQKAAAVASAAILMHSLFDFPLRMAGISAAMAVLLALLAGARGSLPDQASREGKEPRHATL